MKVSYQACQAGWRWWTQADLVPADQKFSCKWNLSFFKAAPIKQAFFLPGQPAPYNSSLFSHFWLFQNVILNKMLKQSFEILSPFFSECSFHWLQYFFFFFSFGYQFELIFSSYNKLPDTSYLTFFEPNGLSKHLKDHQVIGLDLSTSPKSVVKDIILKWH